MKMTQRKNRAKRKTGPFERLTSPVEVHDEGENDVDDRDMREIKDEPQPGRPMIFRVDP